MRFLWWTIERRRKPVALSPMDRAQKAVDDINVAWNELRSSGDGVRPWIIWDEHRVVLSRWEGKPNIVYETKR